MVEYLKKYEKTSIFVSLLSIAGSILLIVNPAGVMNIIISIIGASMILGGLWYVISYFRESKELQYFRLDLFVGIILIVSGILMIKNASALIVFISMVVAVWIILRGILDLQVSLNLKSVQSRGWWIALIMALITIALGIVVFVNPFATAELTVISTGIIMLVSSIFDLGQSIGILVALKD